MSIGRFGGHPAARGPLVLEADEVVVARIAGDHEIGQGARPVWHAYSSFRSRALAIAVVRLCTCSLPKIWFRCHLVVPTVVPSLPAIS